MCNVCLSDVNECGDPEVCGTARCENKEGSYDCLCETGYVYDNESKSCVGECLSQQSRKHSFLRSRYKESASTGRNSSWGLGIRAGRNSVPKWSVFFKSSSFRGNKQMAQK